MHDVMLMLIAMIIKPAPDSPIASILRPLIHSPVFICLILGFPLAFLTTLILQGTQWYKAGHQVGKNDWWTVLLDYSWVLMGVLTSFGWSMSGGGFTLGSTKTTPIPYNFE